MSDSVNNPTHYNSHPSGIECITIAEHHNFCIGNAIKYLWRAGLKGDGDNNKHIEDLKKAVWYIEREIERLGADAPPSKKTGWYIAHLDADDVAIAYRGEGSLWELYTAKILNPFGSEAAALEGMDYLIEELAYSPRELRVVNL